MPRIFASSQILPNSGLAPPFSILDMYLYFAKKFALERYEDWKKEELERANKSEDEDYDEDYDDESDGDYDEEE